MKIASKDGMLSITQYCYIQADRANCPVQEICFPSLTDNNKATILQALNQGWPSHAPFEPYKAWGMDDCWIGSLNHTFKVKLS